MLLKERILDILCKSSAKLSGQRLAEELNVSRAAVWKAVRSLKKEGYAIVGEAGVGYSLLSSPDLLTERELRRFLKNSIPLTCVNETDSTNTLARLSAADDSEYRLFTAERQRGGRGRLGRRFESPEGGIYMSFLLRPRLLKGEQAVSVTAAACVAVCRAIRETCRIETGIKWVNDIYYKGKKVCGILTEAVTCAETGEIERMIIGIGINFSTKAEDFPEELRDIAGSLFEDVPPDVSRARLAAAVADRLCNVEESCITGEYIEEYRSRSIVIGKEVRCIRGSESFKARVTDIDSRGGLVVTDESGETRTLSSGEITLRLN